MKFSELVVLLPCHSLEDFPVHHEGDDAHGLLAAWSCLWHPALLACVGRLPVWYRADAPPEELAGKLIVVPHVSESLLQAGWTSRATSEGALVLRRTTARDELVRHALSVVEGGDRPVPPELQADFLALGLCYLLIELLTRQMRYMSNVDEVHLQNETISAAQAVMAGEHETCRERLQRAFDVLVEARERFYPVDSYLIDLTLVGPTTLGQPLREALAGEVAANYLITASTAEQLAQQPDTLAALQTALERGTGCLVGGDYNEPPYPLLPAELVLGELQHGLAAYEQALGCRPAVYARRRYGLTPLLPPLLEQLGFEGALHATLDDGQFPIATQAKTRWEGLDSSAIDALARVPVDASRPETFLDLPRRIGESMDMDHVATVVLAHWPDQASPYYADLRRASAYGPVLGRFVTLNAYFRDTDSPGNLSRFELDRYRSPYLRQAVIRQYDDPLSSVARLYHKHYAAATTQTLATLAQVAARKPDNGPPEGAVARLGEMLAQPQVHPRDPAVLVFNPLSFSRRVVVDVSSLQGLPAAQDAVLAVQDDGGRKTAVVEVPGCGFAWLVPGPPAAKPRRQKPMAEGHELRNDRFTVVVDETTGGIRAVHLPNKRGNRVTQQIAFRLPQPKPPAGSVYHEPDPAELYSTMVCESLEILAAGPAVARIATTGQLLDRDGRRLAGFRQQIEVAIGIPVVWLDVELDIDEPPRADPWNSYYAARFAWSDESAELFRGFHGTRQACGQSKFEAPEWIELVSENRLAVLTGGLPYHRRTGYRMLDTLLVVRGETQRRFRLALGIDLPSPIHEAHSLLEPPVVVTETRTPRAASGWLFHLDARNAVATHWEPLVDGSRLAGFRVRLQERLGKPGLVTLRTPYRLVAAHQVDFRGQTLVQLPIDADRCTLELAACEWTTVEARW